MNHSRHTFINNLILKDVLSLINVVIFLVYFEFFFAFKHLMLSGPNTKMPNSYILQNLLICEFKFTLH